MVRYSLITMCSNFLSKRLLPFEAEAQFEKNSMEGLTSGSSFLRRRHFSFAVALFIQHEKNRQEKKRACPSKIPSTLNRQKRCLDQNSDCGQNEPNDRHNGDKKRYSFHLFLLPLGLVWSYFFNSPSKIPQSKKGK